MFLFIAFDMSLFMCVVDNCPIQRIDSFSDLRHESLRAAFSFMQLKDFFVCQEHGNFHLCKNDMERTDCITDTDGRCIISGRNRQDAFLWCETPHVKQRRCASITKRYERERVRKIMNDKYTKYNFAQCVKTTIQERHIVVCPKRLNSMIQRLYELFSQAKEEDERKIQLNDETRFKNCEMRLSHLLAVLGEDLTHTRHHEPYFVHYSNSDPGATFRTQVSFLIAHDLSCKEDALMPYSSAFDEPIYVSAYARIFAGKKHERKQKRR